MPNQIKSIGIYFRDSVSEAEQINARLEKLIKTNGLTLITKEQIQNSKPDLVLVLGGDGSILEAVQKFVSFDPLFLGLNLGNVGFLAGIRGKNDFETGLAKVISGEAKIKTKNLLASSILRDQQTIDNQLVLNEIVVQSLLGIVSIDVLLDSQKIFSIFGSGVMISTATGSTAFNLSAHGPILTPEVDGIIITKLLEHNIPTPSIITSGKEQITMIIKDFRKTDRIYLKEDNEPVDVVMSLDGQSITRMLPGDKIAVSKAGKPARFIELESNYFIRSLQEKFNLK